MNGVVLVRAWKLLSATAAAIVLAAAAGCGSSTTTAAPEQEVIRLGALLPLTGGSSHSGEAMRDAAQLAVSEANTAGGVLGRRVELVVADDACDPGTAVTAAHEMIKRDIVVSVGGYCSIAVVPTLKIFRAAGVPMIVPMATSTDLVKPKYDSVFLLSGTVAAEAEFAVGQMKKLGGTRLAAVHDGTSYPMTLAESTVAAAKSTGDLTVTKTLKLSQGATDYRRIAASVLAGRADIVYFTGYYAEANQLIRDLRGAGFTGPVAVSSGAADGPLLEGLTAAQSRHVYGTALIVPQLVPELADWSRRYEAAVGTAPGPSTVEAYDAVTVALDAIKQAGSLDLPAIRQAIAATDATMMTGPVSFNSDGTRAEPTFLLLRAEGGELVRG